ncbi:MAG: hypothetical protein M1829_005883 [Trizodia sp. TS-e1964]|nr:MAG: hypothetical protein M1829_005883 [Trizodia sp. TS-e1964]
MSHESPMNLLNSEDLEEGTLIEALNRLNEMHIKLRQLRTTIPDLIKPLTIRHQSPEAFHKVITAAARKATSDVEAFKNIMESEPSKAILEEARALRSQATERIRPWMFSENPNWCRLAPAATNEETNSANNPVELEVVEEEQDLKAIAEEFKSQKRPRVNIEFIEDQHAITVNLISSLRLHFKILRNVDESGKQNGFQVTLQGNTPSYREMLLRAIRSKDHLKDLKLLLGMLSSYIDLESRPCFRCGKLLDSYHQFPLNRELTPGPSATPQWTAFHPHCN